MNTDAGNNKGKKKMKKAGDSIRSYMNRTYSLSDLQKDRDEIKPLVQKILRDIPAKQ